MKNRKLIIVFALLLLTAMLAGLAACGGGSSSVKSISIKSMPAKTEYTVGDTDFDVSGGVIEVTYRNGTKEDVDMVDVSVSCSGFSTSRQGEVQIKVTYQKKTCNFNILVVSASAGLTSIDIDTLPKTDYFTGNILSLDGGLLGLNYDDGSRNTHPMNGEGVTVGDYSFEKAGSVKITLYYKSLSASFYVTVKAPKATSIKVQKAPDKALYLRGQEIDLTGGLVRIIYEDNSFDELPMDSSSFRISYDFFTELGEITVTVSYYTFIDTFTVTVEEDPKNIFDWEYVDLIFEIGFAEMEYSYVYYEDLAYLHCWFEIDRIRTEVFNSQNQARIYHWNTNYEAVYKEFEYYTDVGFYDVIFFEAQLNEFVRDAAFVMFKSYYHEDYAETSAEFASDMERIITLFKALDTYRKSEFILRIGDAADFYLDYTSLYYEQFLTYEEVEFYYYLTTSQFYWELFSYLKDETIVDLFIEDMQICVSAYNGLSDYTAFEEYFKTDYDYYNAFYQDYKYPDGYDWVYLKDVLYEMTDHYENYDDVLWLHFYGILCGEIEYLQNSGIAEYTEYLNKYFANRIASAHTYYAEIRAYAPNLFLDEDALAFMWFVAEQAHTYVYGSFGSELYQIIAQMKEMYANISNARKFDLLTLYEFEYYYGAIITYYYISEIGFSDSEAYILYYILTTDFYYSAYEASHDAQYIVYIRESMEYAISFYSGTIDTSLFDDYFKAEYERWVEFYYIYCPTRPDGFNWDTLDNIFALLQNYAGGSQTMWLHFYYRLEIFINQINASENESWIYYLNYHYIYELNFVESFRSEWFDMYYSEIFTDAQVNEFLRLYVVLGYTFEFGPELLLTYSAEQLKKMVELSHELTIYQKGLLFAAISDDFDHYFPNLVANYYRHLVGVSVDVSNLIFSFLSAEIWYGAHVYFDASNEGFNFYMKLSIQRYNSLSSTSIFDTYFYEAYVFLQEKYDELQSSLPSTGNLFLLVYTPFEPKRTL